MSELRELRPHEDEQNATHEKEITREDAKVGEEKSEIFIVDGRNSNLGRDLKDFLSLSLRR